MTRSTGGMTVWESIYFLPSNVYSMYVDGDALVIRCQAVWGVYVLHMQLDTNL